MVGAPGYALRADHGNPESTEYLINPFAQLDAHNSVFGAVSSAGCAHQPTVVGKRKPKDLPEFQWINTVLGNLKTSLSGSYHAFDFRKYATRYLAAFTYRFNRRFDLRTLHTRLLVAAATCVPQPQRVIRAAEHHC